MKAHERVWKALSHEEPDRVPTFSQHIEPPFLQRYDDKYEIQDDYGFGPHYDLALAKELGLDSKWQHLSRYIIPDKEQQPELPNDMASKYEGMRISPEGHASIPGLDGQWYQDGVLKTPELIDEWVDFIKTFEPAESAHWKYWGKVWKNGLEQDMVPIPTAGGPTYITWAGIGLDRLAYIMRKYPQKFRKLNDAWVDLTIELHKCVFEVGMDMVFICDDHCYKDRCMFSPKQFKDFLVPNFKRMADNAHKHGAKFLLHSDGFLSEELPLLIEAGVDAAEPLEYEANNRLDQIKGKYGDKIAFIGNVPATEVLTNGTIEDTIKMTKKCLLDAADGGGYMLGPGSDVLGTIKVDNFRAMIETVRKYGTYPIDKSKSRE